MAQRSANTSGLVNSIFGLLSDCCCCSDEKLSLVTTDRALIAANTTNRSTSSASLENTNDYVAACFTIGLCLWAQNVLKNERKEESSLTKAMKGFIGSFKRASRAFAVYTKAAVAAGVSFASTSECKTYSTKRRLWFTEIELCDGSVAIIVNDKSATKINHQLDPKKQNWVFQPYIHHLQNNQLQFLKWKPNTKRYAYKHAYQFIQKKFTTFYIKASCRRPYHFAQEEEWDPRVVTVYISKQLATCRVISKCFNFIFWIA